MPTIKLLKRAELELIEACNWYEKQQKGLSLKFRKDLKFSLNIIVTNPLIYPQRYDTEMRFAVLQKFPFIVVFWLHTNLDTVFVASVFNTNRSPENLP